VAEHGRWREVDDGTRSVNDLEYKAGYDDRWAVLIGINRYREHNPLEFAAATWLAGVRPRLWGGSVPDLGPALRRARRTARPGQRATAAMAAAARRM